MITHRSSIKGNIPSAKNRYGESISPTYGPSGGYTSDSPAAGNPTCPLGGVKDFYHALLTNDPDAKTDVGAGVTVQGGGTLNWYDLAKSKGGMWKSYKPGQKKEYSNAAYGYLSALIEFASGQSFPDFCHKLFWLPLECITRRGFAWICLLTHQKPSRWRKRTTTVSKTSDITVSSIMRVARFAHRQTI